jgi:hypothetical protein
MSMVLLKSPHLTSIRYSFLDDDEDEDEDEDDGHQEVAKTLMTRVALKGSDKLLIMSKNHDPISPSRFGATKGLEKVDEISLGLKSFS